MSRRNKSKGMSIGGAFVPLLFDEMDSEAYISLTGNAAKLFGYFKRAARTVGTKLGIHDERAVTFDYTYTEAKRRGFSEKTFTRCIKELWSKGLIDVVRIGGRIKSESGGRVNSQYRLAKYWQTYGTRKQGSWTDRTKFGINPWAPRSEPDPKEGIRWG